MHPVIFVAGAAVFYALTMILMKTWGALPVTAMAAMVGIAFALGAWCEIEALRSARLSTIYIAILGIETVVISIFAFGVLGETLSQREIVGSVVVLAGLALAST